MYYPLRDYSARDNFGGISVAADARPGSVAAPCVRLDDVVEADAVSLLKIDVEGYELLVLQGAVGLLARSRPVLYVENDRFEKSHALIEWLWAQNYQLFWHAPRLYNPDNLLKSAVNPVDHNVVSLNMVCLPSELRIPMEGLQEITSATAHPLAK